MDRQVMQIPVAELSYAAIDFESAGAAPGETDCPVQVGIVRAESLFDPAPERFCTYIACPHPVRWSASKVHGITSAMLQNAPTLASLWPNFKRLLSNSVVVGHNPATEQRFLRAFPGHGFAPWLDTLSLARKAMPGQADYSLSSLCDTLAVISNIRRLAPGKTWHNALFDAVGSLELLRALVRGLHMENAVLSQLAFAVK